MICQISLNIFEEFQKTTASSFLTDNTCLVSQQLHVKIVVNFNIYWNAGMLDPNPDTQRSSYALTRNLCPWFFPLQTGLWYFPNKIIIFVFIQHPGVLKYKDRLGERRLSLLILSQNQYWAQDIAKTRPEPGVGNGDPSRTQASDIHGSALVVFCLVRFT